MKKKINFYAIIGLLALPHHAYAKDIIWYDGKHQIEFSVNKETDAVVETALQLFKEDMRTLTGKTPRETTSATIRIYQLDKLNNKEFKEINRMGIPIQEFITYKDAFYIANKNEQLIVVGSNGRGTAYGILELSKMAGISPWIWWANAMPKPVKSLIVKDGYELLQKPVVPYRGIKFEDVQAGINTEAISKDKKRKHKETTPQYKHKKIFELLLRLKANVLWQEHEHLPSQSKGAADSCGIILAGTHLERHKNKHKDPLHTDDASVYLADSPQGLAALKKKGSYSPIILHTDDGYGHFSPITPSLKTHPLHGLLYHLHFNGTPTNYLWINSRQPGMIYTALQAAKNEGMTQYWIAAVHHPLFALLPLSLFMDMAWNGAIDTEEFLSKQLNSFFNPDLTNEMTSIFKEYYRLSAIWNPGFSGVNNNGDMATQFNWSTENFGNELERYLFLCKKLEERVETLSSSVPQAQQDIYFRLVKYPIQAFCLMSRKLLFAQEAREISRPGTFHIDDEALQAAVASVKAHNALLELNKHYHNLENRLWNNHSAPYSLPNHLFQYPNLPDSVTHEEMVKFDRPFMLNEMLDLENAVAQNATEYLQSSGQIQHCTLLGHSNSAIDMQEGSSVSYSFVMKERDKITLYLAFIPKMLGQNTKIQVTLDNQSTIINVNVAKDSEEWKDYIWRGHVRHKISLPLNAFQKYHQLKIDVLENSIFFDQWMADPMPERNFYMIPIQ